MTSLTLIIVILLVNFDCLVFLVKYAVSLRYTSLLSFPARHTGNASFIIYLFNLHLFVYF